MQSYRDLIFWQRAFEVSKLVIGLASDLPKDTVSKILISQVVRSSSSIGANIAEGFGRYKSKEYPRFLQIALGSANETEYWLLLIKDAYPKFDVEINLIIEKNLESIKMITASLKTIKSK